MHTVETYCIRNRSEAVVHDVAIGSYLWPYHTTSIFYCCEYYAKVILLSQVQLSCSGLCF